MYIFFLQLTVLGEPYDSPCNNDDTYDYAECVSSCSYEYIADECGCQMWYSERKYIHAHSANVSREFQMSVIFILEYLFQSRT